MTVNKKQFKSCKNARYSTFFDAPITLVQKMRAQQLKNVGVFAGFCNCRQNWFKYPPSFATCSRRPFLAQKWLTRAYAKLTRNFALVWGLERVLFLLLLLFSAGRRFPMIFIVFVCFSISFDDFRFFVFDQCMNSVDFR